MPNVNNQSSLSDGDKNKLISLVENYLKLKKTWWGAWWGRTPKPLFDREYFREKISEIFPYGDSRNGLSSQYVSSLFEAKELNPVEQHFLRYFDKGSVYSNIIYAASRTFQVTRGFFFGRGKDKAKYLEEAKDIYLEVAKFQFLESFSNRLASNGFKVKLNEEQENQFKTLIGDYLQSKKTWWGGWWGRTPKSLLDDKGRLYFAVKIRDVSTDIRLQEACLEFVLDCLKDSNKNQKDILSYFNKGNIFSNISYAIVRGFQIIKGFFFRGGQDRYLEKVKEDFKEIVDAGEAEKKKGGEAHRLEEEKRVGAAQPGVGVARPAAAQKGVGVAAEQKQKDEQERVEKEREEVIVTIARNAFVSELNDFKIIASEKIISIYNRIVTCQGTDDPEDVAKLRSIEYGFENIKKYFSSVSIVRLDATKISELSRLMKEIKADLSKIDTDLFISQSGDIDSTVQAKMDTITKAMNEITEKMEKVRGEYYPSESNRPSALRR